MDKFSRNDLTNAIDELSICEFFPREPGAQAAVMKLLAKMCPHREALRWLVDQFVNRIGKWHGPAELRAVLATRYRPADGIEAFSTLPGFTPEDSEAKCFDEHEQLKVGWAEERDNMARISGDSKSRLLIEGLAKAKGIQ